MSAEGALMPGGGELVVLGCEIWRNFVFFNVWGNGFFQKYSPKKPDGILLDSTTAEGPIR
jgi:hypothetical protein